MSCISNTIFVQGLQTTLLLVASLATHLNSRCQLPAQQHPKTFKYFEQSIGYSHFTTRDMATSALFYGGSGANLGLNWRWKAENFETSTGVGLNGGVLSSQPPKSTYFQTNSRAYLINLGIHHNYLRKLNLNLGQFSWSIGGAVNINLPVRYNSSLGNSSFAADPLFNVSATSKLHWNVSRLEEKSFKFLFINRSLAPAQRYWTWLLNVGIFNFNYRPGYAYSYDSAFNGSETGLFGYYYTNHQFKMNGWRIGSRIAFTKLHANGNGISIFYNWEAMTTKGRYEPLNLAWHQLGITLLIKRKSSL